MRVCAKHRHKTRASASWIWVSVGCGCRSSKALAVRITPLRQKPHCAACSSMNACCSGCGCSSVPSPSSVVISTPVIVPAGVTQERIARPWASTVQAPHWPSPQPNLGPRRLRSSLSTYSSGVAGSTSTVCALPLTVSIMVAIVTSVSHRWGNILVMAKQVRGVVLPLQVSQTLVVRPESLSDQVDPLVGLRAYLVDIEALREGPHGLGELPSPLDMARGFRRVQPGRKGGPLVSGIPVAEGGVAAGDPAGGIAQLLEDHGGEGRGDGRKMRQHRVDSAIANLPDKMGFDVVVAPGGGQGREDLLGCRVGHSLDVVRQGWAKLPDRPQDPLPFLQRTAVADGHDAHFRPVVCGAQATYGVQLVGNLPGEIAEEQQELSGLRKGVEHDPGQHQGTHGMELVRKGGDHAEVPAAAPEAPQEVRVLAGVDMAELAVSSDNIGGNQIVTGQAVLARQPADAAAQGEAGNARVG